MHWNPRVDSNNYYNYYMHGAVAHNVSTSYFSGEVHGHSWLQKIPCTGRHWRRTVGLINNTGTVDRTDDVNKRPACFDEFSITTTVHRVTCCCRPSGVCGRPRVVCCSALIRLNIHCVWSVSRHLGRCSVWNYWIAPNKT